MYIRVKNIYRNAMLIIVGCIVLCIVGCSTSNRLTVGTFNIEWLGDGNNDKKDRSEEDYKAVADVIREMEADIIGVEEVENIEAINRVLKYLPGYSAYIDTHGRAQNVGLIYSSAVNVKVEGEYSPVAIVSGRNRPGLVAHCRKGNFDWIMMVVHLKSTSRYDSTEKLREESYAIRSQQAERIVHWADSIRKNSKEQDIIVVGDFNDFPLRKKNPTLLPMLVDSSMTFLTLNMNSCKYENMKSIDQIFVSNSAKKRFFTGSERMVNFHSALPKKQAENISDHCPVTVQFDVVLPDND